MQVSSATFHGEDIPPSISELPLPLSSASLSPKAVCALTLTPLPRPCFPSLPLLAAAPSFCQCNPWFFFFLPSASLKAGQPDLQASAALPEDWRCVLDSELGTRPRWLPLTPHCTVQGEGLVSRLTGLRPESGAASKHLCTTN